ncbi:MAG: DUF4238 domain-containing protein [Mesorhizobium sp.]|uniref:DUF4238 domain-containing protein n=1 Tax=Mesorhizobium sp. TaxID=1871066 RepID=UPI001201EF68|nr:DUF4238 domain-containing protein [Mesorhizobium sp.]TIL70341.1 MAG: DUF4238 domain-containing protein [Mesorhizobium sp.]TIL87657.1 MAG: DUF4238 domain-containing protein [Mesorhizobium sp.]TIL99119.1 MAG: DUF4238 domain-containing protein [Mesorhizobium sp.]
MALDHYVSQVHLRKFASSELGGRLRAIRKSDLKHFSPRTKDVCRIDEGSTNEYLSEPRAIEEFLKTVEGRYNAAVSSLEAGKPENESIYVIAGFAAYVMSCSPAAMRINLTPMAGTLEITARLLDNDHKLPPPPKELGGKNLTELLDSGKVKFAVDPKYPQAIGISNILRRVAKFGNFRWDILINDQSDCQFFTSDYPVGGEPTLDPRVLNRIVPLAPNLAVRFRPDINLPRNIIDFEFRNFSFDVQKVTRQQAIEINRLLVRTAEETVFFRDDRPWVAGFVGKNRHFRIDTENTQVPQPDGGILLWSRQQVAAFRR